MKQVTFSSKRKIRMTDQQLTEHAIAAANMSPKTEKMYRKAGGVEALREPDTFQRSLGFFSWCKRNNLTKEQKEAYLKTYRENYKPLTH